MLGHGAAGMGTWSLEEVLSAAFVSVPQGLGSPPPPAGQPQPSAKLLKDLAAAQEELEKAREVYDRKQGEVEKARLRALGKRPAVESPVREWKAPAKALKLGPDGAGTSAAHAALAEAQAAVKMEAEAEARQPRSSDEIDVDVVDLTLLDD